MGVARPAVVVFGLSVFLMLAGCTSGESVERLDVIESSTTSSAVPASSSSAAVVVGPLVVHPEVSGEVEEHEAEVIGRFDLIGDCFMLTDAADDDLPDHPIVWPAGTVWREDVGVVVLPGGVEATLGSTLAGSGGFFPRSVAPGVSELSLESIPSGCLVDGRDWAVFNPTGDIEVR